jgi:hypothetical protein
MKCAKLFIWLIVLFQLNTAYAIDSYNLVLLLTRASKLSKTEELYAKIQEIKIKILKDESDSFDHSEINQKDESIFYQEIKVNEKNYILISLQYMQNDLIIFNEEAEPLFHSDKLNIIKSLSIKKWFEGEDAIVLTANTTASGELAYVSHYIKKVDGKFNHILSHPITGQSYQASYLPKDLYRKFPYAMLGFEFNVEMLPSSKFEKLAFKVQDDIRIESINDKEIKQNILTDYKFTDGLSKELTLFMEWDAKDKKYKRIIEPELEDYIPALAFLKYFS